MYFPRVFDYLLDGRTNHAYDPVFLQTAVEGPVPDDDSFMRYLLIHDTILMYNDAGVAIGDQQALNITAAVGDKGASTLPDFLTCSGPYTSQGENIVSTVFLPAQQLLYVAFEHGHGSAHLPAACTPYVLLDMAPWFGTSA